MAIPTRHRGQSPSGALAGSSAPHSSHIRFSAMTLGQSLLQLHSDPNRLDSNTRRFPDLTIQFNYSTLQHSPRSPALPLLTLLTLPPALTCSTPQTMRAIPPQRLA